MTNPDLLFCLLRLLEQEALTTNQMQMKAAQEDFEYNLKTFQRAVNDLRQIGIILNDDNRLYSLPKKSEYSIGFASFFKRMVEADVNLRCIVFGDIDKKVIAKLLNKKDKPAQFFYSLIDATLKSKKIEFLYTPIYPNTERRAVWSKCYRGFKVPKGTSLISMIPHYLVFSGNHCLVLGESELLDKVDCRHYELSCVYNVKTFEPSQKQLTINPHEMYRYSVNIWAGGLIHDVTLEETIPHAKTQITKRKVNGEDEILSYVMASLGRIKIINPPDEIIERAKELELPRKLIFK